MAKKKITVDAEALEMLEEAKEDLMDAEDLSKRGGCAMAMYHAAQSAQKFLAAFGRVTKYEIALTWDLARVYDAVKDEKGVAGMAQDVTLLAESSTPKKAGGTREASQTALRSAHRVERAILILLGLEAPPEIPEPVPTVEAPAVAPVTESAAQGDQVDTPNVPPPERHGSDLPQGRNSRERETSYVKTFLMCKTCGVRLPKTRQTAHGRVPCPHCGKPMTFAQ